MNKLHDEDEESKEKKVDIQQNTAHSEDLNEYKAAKTTSDDHPGLISNEEIKIPEINPVKIVRNEIETFEQKKKQDAYDTMMANIDNYDGTGLGQKDIPS